MRGKIVEECHIGLVQLKPGQPVVVDDMPAPATPEVSQHAYIHQPTTRSPQPPTHYSYIYAAYPGRAIIYSVPDAQPASRSPYLCVTPNLRLLLLLLLRLTSLVLQTE